MMGYPKDHEKQWEIQQKISAKKKTLANEKEKSNTNKRALI